MKKIALVLCFLIVSFNTYSGCIDISKDKRAIVIVDGVEYKIKCSFACVSFENFLGGAVQYIDCKTPNGKIVFSATSTNTIIIFEG